MVPTFVSTPTRCTFPNAELANAELAVFGGGAADFLPRESNKNVSKLDKFAARGYGVVHDNSSLWELPVEERALGLFTSSTMPTWLDRNVFVKNMETYKAWDGTKGTPDVPGLKDMTLK